MTNVTKWLIALPFVFLIALVLPAAVAGDWLWFAGHPADALFVTLTAGMWLAATAFVDVSRPRGPRDVADTLISLGLILTVPVAVADRVYGPAARLPGWVGVAGLLLGGLAVVLGVSARAALGRAYRPRDSVGEVVGLARSGPYRWVRHPMYGAALLWGAGWPLIMSSFLGAGVALLFLLPALMRRMVREEADLWRVYGHAYDDYSRHTWRLVPYVY